MKWLDLYHFLDDKDRITLGKAILLPDKETGGLKVRTFINITLGKNVSFYCTPLISVYRKIHLFVKYEIKGPPHLWEKFRIQAQTSIFLTRNRFLSFVRLENDKKFDFEADKIYF